MKKLITLIIIFALTLFLTAGNASDKSFVSDASEKEKKPEINSLSEHSRIHTRDIEGLGTVECIERIDLETGKIEIIINLVKNDCAPGLETGIAKTNSVTMIPSAERNALITLFECTGGWTHWDRTDGWIDSPNWEDGDYGDPGTECDWYGVTCNADRTHVIGINLQDNGLYGNICDMSGLTQLEHLDLSLNTLAGSIHTSIGSLTNLGYLDLSNNSLSGTIPDLSNCTNLGYFDLGTNQIGGTLPTWLNNLTNLTALYFGHNQLTGTIPDFSNCTNLELVGFPENQLSGTIPGWLNNLTGLNYILLEDNQFTGAIPDLSSLSQLGALDLSHNQLSGEFPSWLANHTSLYTLDLGYNQLSGMISDLSNLINVGYLYLDNNQFSGYLPRLYGATNLKYLFLAHNQFMGPISGEIRYLTLLKGIRLNGNKLKGIIPSSLTNLTNLIDYYSLIHYNGVYTDDPILKSFLDLKMGNWEDTQTLPPENLYITDVTDTSVTLHWDPILYQGGSGGYRIYYTSDAMGAFYLLKTLTDKSLGSYVVPGILDPGTTYSFAIKAFTDPHINNRNELLTDYSEVVSATTTIDPVITVINPNGGQSWAFGSTKNITWDAQGVPGDVKLNLRQGNTLVGVIVWDRDPASGSYTWTAGQLASGGTAAPGTNYIVRVKEMTGEMTYDDSDAPFEITGVRLTSPNGGESWQIGSTQTISWDAHGITGELKLVLWKDGVQVGRIVNGLAPTSGTYTWTVGENINGTAEPGAGYTIRVRLIGTSTVDESDLPFTLTN